MKFIGFYSLDQICWFDQLEFNENGRGEINNYFNGATESFPNPATIPFIEWLLAGCLLGELEKDDGSYLHSGNQESLLLDSYIKSPNPSKQVNNWKGL